MIKLSRMADYAILLVSKMAQSPDKTFGAQELSNYSSLPITTVNKLLSKLSRSKIIDSYRGVAGGYKLIETPEEITIKSIIDLIDGKVALTACSEESADGCNIASFCHTQRNWQIINNAVCSALDSVTIAEMNNPEDLFKVSDIKNKKNVDFYNYGR